MPIRAFGMNGMIKRFLRDRTGATAAEYGLILAIIGVGIGAAALALGANVAFSVDNSAKSLQDVKAPPAS